MNKFFLCIALMFGFVLSSCDDERDELWSEVDSLADRVAELEANVVTKLNKDVTSLRTLLDKSTVIVGTQTTDDGYTLELSDGTKLDITLGAQLNALVPVIGIDEEGFWTFSLDNGKTFHQIKMGGSPVSAYPKNQAGEPITEGVTPQLRVDAEGYWELSFDGVEWQPLMNGGDRVNALGQNKPIEYSGFFKSVSYNEETKILSVELLTGEKVTFHVEDSFRVEITAKPQEVFLLEEVRQFEVVQQGTKDAMVKTPKGWTAVLEDQTLMVTAPKTFMAGVEEIKVIVTSEKNYLKTASLKVSLVNKTVDATACEAWRNFKAGTADNVLLDYSYAGYKHAEEAPADGFAWGYKVYNVVDYGADPTGVKSSRGAFEKLLKELRLSGFSDSGSRLANANAQAVIYFPEGRFILHNDEDNSSDAGSKNQTEKDSKGNNVSSEIFIHGGNFVIKGAGRDKTFLVMDTPNLPSNPAEMYSSPEMINIKHNSGLTDLTSVTSDAEKGTFEVEVGSTLGIQKGDWVCLYLKNNDPALVAQELYPHVVENNMEDIKTILVEDLHQVKSVSGNRVTFHEPIMHAVEARWGWSLKKYPHYENVGIEDLTFEGHAKENFVHHASWQDDGAYKPLQMMRLTNSWIRRVNFTSVSEALTISFSANCSAYDILIDGNRGHSGVRSRSSSRLFFGKIIESAGGDICTPPHVAGGYLANAGQYHASGVSNTSLGAVLWRNHWGDDSFFESHSKQPRATLVDNCQGGFVQWRFGGADTNVPNHLSDLTMWNFDATRVAHDFGANPFKWWRSDDLWWKIMPPIIIGLHGQPVTFDTDPAQIQHLESNGTPVEPQSLYEAQLRERLGYVPAWLNSLK